MSNFTFAAVLWYRQILLKPVRLVLFLVIAALTIMTLQWLLELDTLLYILGGDNGLDLWGRLRIIYEALGNVFRLADNIIPITFISLGFLQASSMVYLISLRIQRANLKRTLLPLYVGVIGSGCVACGGSLLAPILAALSSGLGAALVNRVGALALVAAVIYSYSTFMKVSNEYQRFINASGSL